MTRRRGRRPVRWAWLLDSPLVLATWITVVLGAWSLARVGESLGHVARMQTAAEAEFARLAADTVLMQVEPRALLVAPQSHRLGEVFVGVSPFEEPEGGAGVFVDVRLATGRDHSFVAPLLPGAAPKGFGCARSWQVPGLAAGVLASAVHAEDLVAFRRDETIALMHRPGGTDLADFVLDSTALDCPREVVVVPGHLWTEPGAVPVVVRIARDTTILVRGNCYLGQSLVVEGNGRLVLAVVGDAAVLPANRGEGEPLEGVGRLQFGFRAARAAGGQPLQCDATLVVAGEVVVEQPAIVTGAFLAAAAGRRGESGPTGSPRLELRGERLFEPTRERVPGFAVSGPPRPGLLRIAAPRSAGPAPENSPELALYGAPLGR
ncbi:MAG: hypothetical protein NXI31_15650 [bacterium]|nr:hypothetical protein [bacterium]